MKDNKCANCGSPNVVAYSNKGHYSLCSECVILLQEGKISHQTLLNAELEKGRKRDA